MQTNNTTNPAYGAWMVPKLRIRNTGQFAQDATAKWGVTPYERDALVSSSLRLKNANVMLEPNKITLAPKLGSAAPWQHVVEWSTSLPFPFITRETETFIPLTIWENAAFFFTATMPEQSDASSEPFFSTSKLVGISRKMLNRGDFG
jgi:hypothetical protein